MAARACSIRQPRRLIKNVLLPLDHPDAGHLIRGLLVRRPITDLTPGRPTVVADLHVSAESPIGPGSLVELADAPPHLVGHTLFVTEVNALNALLFDNDTDQRLPDVPLSSLIHKSQVVECISAQSIASPHTKFGVGLTGRAKQAWLRDDAYGCAYVPGPRELLALHEVSDDVFFTYSSAGPDAVGSASGDSVNVRFSEAQAHRAASRARRYITATRLLAADDDSYQLEKFFAHRFDEYSHTLGKTTFLVLLTRTHDGGRSELRALVADDLVSLPASHRMCLVHDSCWHYWQQ